MSTTTTKPKVTPCVKPSAVLPDPMGLNRYKAFRNGPKYDIVNKIVQKATGASAQSVYQVNLTGFINLLKKFDPASYNGVRVYFGCYPDTQDGSGLFPAAMNGQLALLFVPTRKSPNFSPGIDDPSQFWHLGMNEQPDKLPAPGSVAPDSDFVTKWIGHYRTDRMKPLEAGQSDANFQETRSHWYSIETFVGDAKGKDIGLFKYLDCAMDPKQDNPIIELYLQFGAFVSTDPYPVNQLTLLYYFRQKNDPVPTTDKVELVSHAVLLGSTVVLHEATGDTGVPCPPATNCPGSSVSSDLKSMGISK